MVDARMRFASQKKSRRAACACLPSCVRVYKPVPFTFRPSDVHKAHGARRFSAIIPEMSLARLFSELYPRQQARILLNIICLELLLLLLLVVYDA